MVVWIAIVEENMNKDIKQAIAKGKALREEQDQKLSEKARQAEDQKKIKEAQEKAELEADAERYLAYVPDALTKAIAKRQPSFCLLTCETDNTTKFDALTKLIEPKLKKMGLQFKHTSSTSWVQLSFDPDTGYDAKYYHLEVMVPEEAL
jgi:hypothetical protein